MKDQQKILRAARAKLAINSEDMAARLGVSLPTLRSWLLPKTSKAHRDMPRSAQLLLEHLIAAHKAAKRKR